MPTYIGSDISSVVCSHPTLGEFRFQVKSNESFTIDPGGLRSNDDANFISGAGTFGDQINRVRPFFEGPVMVDPLSSNEKDNLPLLAGNPQLGTWTVTAVSGAIWKLLGKPVGDLQIDNNTAQLTLKVAGSGTMETIAPA